MSKHMRTVGSWDDVVPLACAAYNFLPNEYSKGESILPNVWKRPYPPYK